MDGFVRIFFAAALPTLSATACAQRRDSEELVARSRTGESEQIIGQRNDKTAILLATQDSPVTEGRVKDSGSNATPQSFTLTAVRESSAAATRAVLATTLAGQ
jgi:hypothetical protein